MIEHGVPGETGNGKEAYLNTLEPCYVSEKWRVYLGFVVFQVYTVNLFCSCAALFTPI